MIDPAAWSPDLIPDLLLALLLPGLALFVVAARQIAAALIGFVAVGLVLALAWVRLGSVDVALTEAALGSGLAGFLLFGALRRLPAETARPPAVGLRVAAGLLSVLVAAGLAALVLSLPEPAPTLAPAAVKHLPELGVGNPVTAVLVAYRAIDTLMEAIVLVPVLIAIWSLAPERAWGGRPAAFAGLAPRPVLTLLVQVIAPLAVVVGVHLFWTATSNPGGAFQGGSVIAAAWVLAMAAGLAAPPPVSRRWPRVLAVAAGVVFIGVGAAGAWLGHGFLGYPPGLAKPLILLVEAVLVLSIAVSMGLLLAGPPGDSADSGERR